MLSNRTHRATADIAIFGGGIAGLWLLNRLRRVGYSVVLFEVNALGGGQTIASQGIIHGGAKYSLSGNLTEAARTIGDMPAIWKSCLAGTGELDLRGVRVLSDHQYLWAGGSIGSRLAGFFASKAMRSRIAAVAAHELPAPFDPSCFTGRLYRLNEPVLDVRSVIMELSRQQTGHCFKIDPTAIDFAPDDPGRISIQTGRGAVELSAQQVVFSAGEGNVDLLRKAGRSHPAMQLRPLHMVMLKGDLPVIYGHCVEASINPRLTITSYPSRDGETLWYLGGQLAEKGIGLDRREQIAVAKAEVRAILPWIDISGARWSSLRINRAEPKTAHGRRPESYFYSVDQKLITAWPTKLAFAPRLASDISTAIEAAGIGKHEAALDALAPLPAPPVSTTPWEDPAQWS